MAKTDKASNSIAKTDKASTSLGPDRENGTGLKKKTRRSETTRESYSTRLFGLVIGVLEKAKTGHRIFHFFFNPSEITDLSSL